MDDQEEMEVAGEMASTCKPSATRSNEEDGEKEASIEASNDTNEKMATERKETVDPTTLTANPTETNDLKDSNHSLTFQDFVDLQIRMVLMPYIEEEGKGAVVASYAENSRFEGLVLSSIEGSGTKSLQTTDFTDILGILRDHPTPITLIFEGAMEDDDEKLLSVDVDTSTSRNIQVHEEKKDDDGIAKPSTPSHSEDVLVEEEQTSTPKTTNALEKFKSPKVFPKPSYLEKRKTTPSREHTQSLNSVLDDHRNQNHTDKTEGNLGKPSLSSGITALSAWGMRMKAQAEKHLATAKATQQQQQQQQQKQPANESSSQQQQQQLPCDMYMQSNLGTYFPIAKHSKTNRPLHLQSVTTSSLYCIRKSATQPCPKETIYKGNPVQYSFQWYHSSSKTKNSRDRYPISPTAFYQNSTFTDASMDESTQTSLKSRLYASDESISSSCSSWSKSSSESSFSDSTYSLSTAGVTNNTVSVATSATNTTKDATTTTKGTSTWIPLEGATKASFQPNATLVGKRLRCIVTIRPATGSSSDNDDNTDSSSANDAEETSGLHNSTNNEKDGFEKIICDLAVPIQADMMLFNGARQALGVKGSASFANLVGRGSLATKTFRVEIGTTRQVVLYTPLSCNSSADHQEVPKPQRRLVHVNKVYVDCRSTKPQDEDYVRLTDVPLFQVTAKATPNNSKHVDLFFPLIPPVSETTATTRQFLAQYCNFDPSNPAASIPCLQLETPNRMTRESFLLALGIANFRGKSSQLDHQKVLFRDDEPVHHKAKDHPIPESSSETHDTKMPQAESQPVQQQQQEPDDFKPRESERESLVFESPVKGQVVAGNFSLSPCPPSNVIGNSRAVLSPISCQLTADETNPPQVPEPTVVGPSIPLNLPSEAEANLARLKHLERDLEMLRAKLARKDKIVNELQQQVQGSEMAHQRTKHILATTRKELKQSKEDCERVLISKRHVERSLQSQHEAAQRLEASHKEFVHGLEQKLSKRETKIADLEKLNRALQNEKAILGATVEARESKLVKLEELQISNSELSKKVAEQGTLEAQLEETNTKHERLQQELERRKEAEEDCRKELEASKATIQTLHKKMQGEREKALVSQNQLDVIQKKNQQLKGERNSYKQKNESLSKEVARLCRGGKNIQDIEKVLADHESLLQEVGLLRIQKRKALEDAHKYRVSYEQAKAAEEVLSLKPDERETRRILERTAELERLLAEMTDYVSAKQMQLDTMKEVNEELQREIHSLAQANLRRDEV